MPKHKNMDKVAILGGQSAHSTIMTHTNIIWTLALLFGTACTQDKEKVIREKVALRVEDFVKKERATCNQELMYKANKIVDSMLLADAQQQLRDSLNRQRPFRPDQPPNVPPIDSLEVKPIFPDKK
jgi:hypothetical protein